MSLDRHEFYTVQPDGELIPHDDFGQEDDQVYVVVDNQERLIFLWKGQSAGVRQKFIGSRATGDKRKERGYHYRIEVMDQDDETSAFVEHIMGGEPAKATTGVVKDDETPEESFTSYAEAAAAQGIELSDEEIREKSATGPGKIGKMGGVGARPQKSFLADPNFFEDVKDDKGAREKISGVLQETSKDEAIELINALGSPNGYDREMVVVGNRVYRVKLENEDDISLTDLDNPLDGIIMVREYTPRLICENGKVKAIELLKQTSEEAEIDESLTQDLEDLTAMFQIEIE